MDLYTHDQTCLSLPAGIDLTKCTGQVARDGKVMVCQGHECFNLNKDGSLQAKLTLAHSIDYAASYDHEGQISVLGGFKYHKNILVHTFLPKLNIFLVQNMADLENLSLSHHLGKKTIGCFRIKINCLREYTSIVL